MTTMAAQTSAHESHEVWSRLVGEMVWDVRPGYGSFLTMNFGPPWLDVRETVAGRRLVSVLGRLHLWIKYARWQIHTAELTVVWSDPEPRAWTRACKDLTGQRLQSVFVDGLDQTVLAFDQGGRLEIAPNGEFTDDVWSLFGKDGWVISRSFAGDLVTEVRQA